MQEQSQPGRVREILSDLESLRENLLALSDDIWLSIDHNDPDALEEGYEFKRAYNEKLVAFNEVASDLSGLVQRFTAIQIEPDVELEGETGEQPERSRERIIQELDRSQPHSLDENFTYKRPYGYVLHETAHKDLVTWKRVYLLICRQLAGCDLDRFRSLPEHPDFISNRGNSAFSRDRSLLREPLEIGHGMYAESHYSANDIRNNLRKLLIAFGVDYRDLKIYFREDRNVRSD